MKKLVIVVVVLIAVLAVAPWGVGKVAEMRLNQGTNKLLEVAPYLKVVDQKYTRGWFKSEQVITFEAFGSWMKALSPKGLEDMAKAAADEASGKVESSPETDAPADEAPVADVAPKVEEMMRFTVRNEVLHGPILGLTGFGIARVNSHLVLDEKIRKELEKVFGPKSPVEVTTRVGFLGGGTTTFKSEGRTIKPDDSQTEITWETAKLSIGYSRNFEKYDLDGKWPIIEVSDKSKKTHLTVSKMTVDGDGKRVSGDLYDGDVDFGIEKISFLGENDEKIEVNDAHYIVNTETKGDFTSVGGKMGVGEVKAKELTAQGITLKEVHYDFTVRRLHTQTLQKLLTSLKEMYSKPLTDSADLKEAMFAPYKEHGIELLKYDPEFVIDRMGIVTPEGDGYIKGVVKLQGATAEDFAEGSMSIIGKIHADFTIDVSEKMIQKFPNGSTGAGAAVDSGYAKREGDRLICKIVFAKGQLTVNGKPQAIPGLGGPPPGAEAQAPPARE